MVGTTIGLRRKVRHPWLGGPRRLATYLATLDCATWNPNGGLSQPPIDDNSRTRGANQWTGPMRTSHTNALSVDSGADAYANKRCWPPDYPCWLIQIDENFTAALTKKPDVRRMRAGLLFGALRRQTLHSPSFCIQAKLRRSRKEGVSQRTILIASQN